MPKLRTEVSTGQFPQGRECECARCGTRFIDLAAFDDHLPGECPSVTVSASVDPGSPIPKFDPVTRAFAPAKRHARHGARAASTNRAQGMCRKGLHRKIGPGACGRCHADRQRDYRTRARR